MPPTRLCTYSHHTHSSKISRWCYASPRSPRSFFRKSASRWSSGTWSPGCWWAHVPIPLLADIDRIHILSELGVILLMFALGLEFSVRKLSPRPDAGFITAVQVGC